MNRSKDEWWNPVGHPLELKILWMSKRKRKERDGDHFVFSPSKTGFLSVENRGNICLLDCIYAMQLPISTLPTSHSLIDALTLWIEWRIFFQSLIFPHKIFTFEYKALNKSFPLIFTYIFYSDPLIQQIMWIMWVNKEESEKNCKAWEIKRKLRNKFATPLMNVRVKASCVSSLVLSSIGFNGSSDPQALSFLSFFHSLHPHVCTSRHNKRDRIQCTKKNIALECLATMGNGMENIEMEMPFSARKQMHNTILLVCKQSFCATIKHLMIIILSFIIKIKHESWVNPFIYISLWKRRGGEKEAKTSFILWFMGLPLGRMARLWAASLLFSHPPFPPSSALLHIHARATSHSSLLVLFLCCLHLEFSIHLPIKKRRDIGCSLLYARGDSNAFKFSLNLFFSFIKHHFTSIFLLSLFETSILIFLEYSKKIVKKSFLQENYLGVSVGEQLKRDLIFPLFNHLIT